MGTFGRYFDRGYYRTMEKRFSIKPLVYCWLLNFIVALAVFSASMYMFADIIIAVLHTFIGWTVTLTISIVYWLSWIQKRIKGGKNVKYVASSAMIIMFLVALMFIIRTFTLILRSLGFS